MHYIKNPDRNEWHALVTRPVLSLESVKSSVENIFKEVRDYGDVALRKFTYKYDGVTLENFAVSNGDLENSCDYVEPSLREAIEISIKNIRKFHQLQEETFTKVETAPGVLCWSKNVPIEQVGLYVPGGTAPLFSSLLMLAIPAQIAGCEDIIICTPPKKDGSINNVILFCAQILGLDKIFKIGGAQAIAALTYGTETIPSVFKIFGPGNQYVTMAKQIASLNGVAIDMPAGPSEVAVLADDSADPEFVAADLLSQAEHGEDSQVILVTTSQYLLTKVQVALKEQLNNLPRKSIAAASLQNSHAILFSDVRDAIDFINTYAPEHLILMTHNAEDVAELVKNAGSVFLGHYTPEAAGDYASGTNHTLPTNGYARNHSGVSLHSFYKKITFQHISYEGLKQLGPTIERMAEAEDLYAHKNAVAVRQRKNT